MLSFLYTCGLDPSLEVSDKLLHFIHKYNLTFSCFCKYLLLKIENMEVFIFFKFSDERIFIVSKMCSQINVSISSMKSFFSFAKNNKNMMCILGDCRWHANILLWNIVRVFLQIATTIEYLKNLHFVMVRVWECQYNFVNSWP